MLIISVKFHENIAPTVEAVHLISTDRQANHAMKNFNATNSY